MIKSGVATAGGLAAAFGASLCCTAPLLAAFAGIGGAGVAASFEPLRPYLLVASALLFVLGGVALYRRPAERDREPADACKVSGRRRTKVLFWVALGTSLILASFPWWSGLLV